MVIGTRAQMDKVRRSHAAPPPKPVSRLAVQ